MVTNCILIVLISFILVYFSTRKIIRISYQKQLFDDPSADRKIHTIRTPNLGGVAIFGSLVFTSLLFLPAASIHDLRYIMACAFVIFIVGLLDDLIGISPWKKFGIQLLVAAAVTLTEGYRITSFYGLFGINELPLLVSIVVSILFIMLLINAFNLIDGINCLAGGIGLLVCGVFSFFFWKMQETGLLFLSLGMCGCLAAFLLYNRTPAHIFMGDTGSLFIGFIVAVFSIRFIELNKISTGYFFDPVLKPAPAIVLGLLIIPIYDTLRVFFLRLMRRKSPFLADRNHIHHILIDLKFSHLQSTAILLVVNIVFIVLVYFLRSFGIGALFLIVTMLLMSLNGLLWMIVYRRVNRAREITDPYLSPELSRSLTG